MLSICKEQDKEGISFLDVSLAYPRYNEALSYEKLIPQINSSISIPIFIASTNIAAIKTVLEHYFGKPVINSISLKKGITHIKRTLNLIKENPACAAALAIDEKGLAYTA